VNADRPDDALSDSLSAMRSNMRAFYRLLGERSPGGTVVQSEGLLAAVVPSCPRQSVVNGVVYEHADEVIASHGTLVTTYAEAGVDAWRVWVSEKDRALAQWLEQAGHRLAGRPRAMTLDLDRAELTGDAQLDWERGTDAASLASLNEQAYGLPAGELAAVMQALAAGAAFYLARDHGEPAACLATIDRDGDCGVYSVATKPGSRKRGLASSLLGHALLDAQTRGCTTSSLQSSPMGFSVYERLGYRDRGAIEVWEHTGP
jgi:GNAT superfamily N-acetyltransferase